jgi:D-glycero-alpha-D-manno-heptose-7-phosphate kinase
VSAALEEIAALSRDVRGALLAGETAAVAALLRREWEARKRLAPSVTTPEVDRIVEIALQAGGAAKVCGAGGGGMVAVWDARGEREALARALAAAGFSPVPFRVDAAGLSVTSL